MIFPSFSDIDIFKNNLAKGNICSHTYFVIMDTFATENLLIDCALGNELKIFDQVMTLSKCDWMVFCETNSTIELKTKI